MSRTELLCASSEVEGGGGGRGGNKERGTGTQHWASSLLRHLANGMGSTPPDAASSDCNRSIGVWWSTDHRSQLQLNIDRLDQLVGGQSCLPIPLYGGD
jgi:hypothetical protein